MDGSTAGRTVNVLALQVSFSVFHEVRSCLISVAVNADIPSSFVS